MRIARCINKQQSNQCVNHICYFGHVLRLVIVQIHGQDDRFYINVPRGKSNQAMCESIYDDYHLLLRHNLLPLIVGVGPNTCPAQTRIHNSIIIHAACRRTGGQSLKLSWCSVCGLVSTREPAILTLYTFYIEKGCIRLHQP